jgi:hypothetical protein
MTTAKVAGITRKRAGKTTCPKKGARKKVGNKMMTVKGNHRLKSDATKSAAATRKTGKSARIVKSATCGYTVLIAGTAKKKTTTRKCTTRRRSA